MGRSGTDRRAPACTAMAAAAGAAAAARKVSCVVVGAGERGTAYARYATVFPDLLQVTAVCEPRAARRRIAADRHGLSADAAFDGWAALLDRPKLADFAIIATQASLSAPTPVLLPWPIQSPSPHRPPALP